MTQEKPKMRKMIYTAVIHAPKSVIKELGFSEWLKHYREELCDEFDTDKVSFFSYMGRVVVSIGVERPAEPIEKMGISQYGRIAQDKLRQRFKTKQAFVVI